SGSGKGTVAAQVAERLGYRLLDSGALYRITGLVATRAGMALEATNAERIAALIAAQQLEFTSDQRVLVNGEDVSLAIRTEEAGMNA
ncbi:(d)CMP kinase, partial [Klebsiella pneumoniae]